MATVEGRKKLYLSSPHMGGGEMAYIQKAFDDNWIAPLGENVDEFEKTVAAYLGYQSAAATVSGTAALHLAVKLAGVKQGDTVFCSSFTFLGSIDGVVYEKAQPVFIDSEPDTLNMSPNALETAFIWAQKNNKMPKAVIIVDLYGASADYDKLLPICRRYNVPVIEDAAESLGAEYKGKRSGSFGDMSILSFNGNKIITTSGGGMFLSKNSADVDKARFWSTQSREKAPHYEHKEIGYNYRLSNICAGIGRGQMNVLHERVAQKKAIHERYVRGLVNTPLKIFSPQGGYTNYWLSLGVLDKNCAVSYIDIINKLSEYNIESRSLWKPMHLQPLFKDAKFFKHDKTDVCAQMFSCGICLPSDTKMTIEQQDEVIAIIKEFLK